MRALGKEGGRKFMEGLGRQQPNYRPSHVLILQLVAANAARMFVNFVLSKETQTLIRSFGRTVSRTDIPQEENAKFKVVVEEIELADRMNEIVAEYEKYLQ